MLQRRVMVGVGLMLTMVVGWSSARLWGQNPPAGQAELQKIAEGKVAIAKKALGYLDQQMNAGLSSVEGSELRAKWNRRLAEAQIAAAADNAARLAAAQAYLSEAQKLRDHATAMYNAGGINSHMVFDREFEVAEAQTMVSELKGR